jgi:mannose-6-phosphate isomerase-like protein (cupin superfamily)/DNA-binding XRE family transcriptional regulator
VQYVGMDGAKEGAASGEGLGQRLGELVRGLREERGMSLRGLAGRAELSAGLVCELEQGKVQPTVRTLLKLADALGVRPDGIMAALAGDDGGIVGHGGDLAAGCGVRVMRRGGRPELGLDGGLSWQGLLPGAMRGCSMGEVRLPPGGSSGEQAISHVGEEFGLVLEGRLRVDLPGGSHELEEGDCICYPSGLPHRLSNIGEGEARAFWANFGGGETF